MNKASRIFIAGHKGLVGSALVRKLEADGHSNLIMKTKSELNLKLQQEVETFFSKEKPEYVFLAAARVGGIVANDTYPAEFIYDNLMIQANVINAAYRHSVKRLLFLGSGCIYPKFALQPIKEEYLLTGELEPTNEPYALAKIAGLKMCEAYNRQYGTKFISVMPTNLYGPNDNFNLQTSHVLPAMIRKFYEAKLKGAEVVLWGTGTVRREFLHVDDVASACVFLMNLNGEDFEKVLVFPNQMVNLGIGEDITIKELAEMIARVVGYNGNVTWDRSKPDGTPQKMLDSSKIRNLGWMPRIKFGEGVKNTYEWYRNNVK